VVPIPRRWPRLTTHSPVSQVIEHAPFGVARISDDMRFVAVNPRLGALLREVPDQVVGTELARFISLEDRIAVLRQVRGLWSGVVPSVEFESPILPEDGSSVWLRWNLSGSLGADGAIADVLATVEDATPLHKADVAAAEHLAALERLDYLIAGFASMVSHETRTALTGIQGMSELILSGDSEPGEVREYAKYIFNDAERLNRLLGDMLDLSHMQTRQFKLRGEPVNVNQIARQTVERSLATGLERAMILDLDDSVPSVTGDPDRLKQLIENLTRFAVRCSKKDSRIDVSSRQVGNSVHMRIGYAGTEEVVDFDDWLHGRYERYEKNPSSITGVGLGLAIARVIVERHGGQIWVDNTSGIACELGFAVPIAAAKPGLFAGKAGNRNGL
jgi:PAS domain S-box-containing protein